NDLPAFTRLGLSTFKIAHAVVARDIQFPHFWWQLRAVGWTYKRPSGLASEGRRVQIEEQAKNAAAGTTTTAGATTAVASAGTTTAEVQTTSTVEATQPAPFGDPAESFGASQIDTSVALSPNTSGEELSQAAVEHSYSLSPGDFQPDASQFNAAVNLQLLSEASGFESGAERSDEEPREPDPPVQTLHQRTCVKYDVNFVLEDKDESDYKSFSSGKGEGLGDNDDEPEQNDIDDDDDVLSKGAAKKQQKTAQRATQWTAVFSNFKANVTVYAGMNNKKAQPISELRTQTSTISSKSTDGQAIEDKQRVEGRHGRVESVKQIRQRLKMKRRYKTHDILRALVVLIARMLCPQNSRFTDHWAMMEDGTDLAGNFGCFMARNRCQDILRDLNYVDNAAPRIQDKFWKL
ncbi:hypothetical protein F442_02702, partial [Phytophthora nicotianae P10297]